MAFCSWRQIQFFCVCAAMVLEVDVCIEVAEAITLFLSLLHAHMKHVQVEVCWSPVSTNSPHLQSQANQTTTECVIQAHGLGAYFLDGVVFIKKLYTSSPAFRRFIKGHAWPVSFLPVQLVCRRIGDHSAMTCYAVEGVQGENGLNIRESVQIATPHHLPTTSLSFTLTSTVYWKDLKRDMARLSQYLHLLHIINPEVDMRLQLLSNEEYQTYAQFHREASRSLLKTPFKVATLLHHYHPLPLHAGASRARAGGKLHLVKGDTIVLPSCVHSHQTAVAMDLELCCAVALLPHKPLIAGRKIRADHCCTDIKINIFGPAALPLLRVSFSLPHSLLADWEQYGITLVETQQAASVGHSPQALVSALQYTVLSRTADTQSRILQVFVFLEHTERCRNVIGENHRWARDMDVTNAVRKDLLFLVTLHSAKFHHAMHSTLNKLLYNHTTQAELSRRLDMRVIPTLGQAVSSIIIHSRNQDFKHQCKTLLQLGEHTADDSVANTLTHKLWQLARLNLDIDPPDSPGLPPPRQPLEASAGLPSLTPRPSHHFEALSSAPDSELEAETCSNVSSDQGANMGGKVTLEGANTGGTITLEGTESWNQKDETVEGVDMWGKFVEGANMWEEPMEGADNMWEEPVEGASMWEEPVEEANMWKEPVEGADMWEEPMEGAAIWEDVDSDTTLKSDGKIVDFENLGTFSVNVMEDSIKDVLTPGAGEPSNFLDITDEDLAWNH